MNIERRRIVIVCVCCSRNTPAVDAFPVPGQRGQYRCGDCDAGVADGCPNCDRRIR